MTENLLSRLRERYRSWQTPAGDVEKAPRHERRRRSWWMVASTLAAGGVVVASMLLARELGYPMGSGPAVLAFVLLDFRLFGWGFDRFDLVAPWQFREVADDD